VAPLEASRGQKVWHRLNRGGSWQANSALYIVVISRLRHDVTTQTYAARRTAEDKIQEGDHPLSQALRGPSVKGARA
jgi:hypothetical protein